MEVNIPSRRGNISVEVPEKNILYIALPKEHPPVENRQEEINRALDNPIGSDKLENLVSPNKRICIIVDDLTRPTPQREILPLLLERITSKGVPKGNITIVIALGTHRPMSREEIISRCGEDIYKNFRTVNSDYTECKNYVNLGTTSLGTPIEVHKEVYYADIKIGIGNIVPHVIAGWGGGGKIIQPGVCGEKTTERTHLMGMLYSNVLDLPGNIENNIARKEMDSVAMNIGLNFILNTVLDTKGRLIKAFTGDFLKAHREGVKFAESLYMLGIPGKADIVITSAYPADTDFWQGFKPFAYAHMGLKAGGTLIFYLDAPEGLSGDAPIHEETLRRWAKAPKEEIKTAIDQKETPDIIGIATCLGHTQLLPRATVYCISKGLEIEDKEALGFQHAESIKEALEKALAHHGDSATIGIIPYGGYTLVREKI